MTTWYHTSVSDCAVFLRGILKLIVVELNILRRFCCDEKIYGPTSVENARFFQS